jgi:hypothetical protein
MESQDQTYDTKLSVANVVTDRQKPGQSLCTVLKQPGAFSWYPRNRFKQFKPKNPLEEKARKEAAAAALASLKGVRARGMKHRKFVFLNHKRLGKRFKTKNRLLIKGDLAFY